jgi:hypothetical protein
MIHRCSAKWELMLMFAQTDCKFKQQVCRRRFGYFLTYFFTSIVNSAP